MELPFCLPRISEEREGGDLSGERGRGGGRM